ncbi:unnamed protein product, partial [marine sediment metagenome]
MSANPAADDGERIGLSDELNGLDKPTLSNQGDIALGIHAGRACQDTGGPLPLIPHKSLASRPLGNSEPLFWILYRDGVAEKVPEGQCHSLG